MKHNAKARGEIIKILFLTTSLCIEYIGDFFFIISLYIGEFMISKLKASVIILDFFFKLTHQLIKLNTLFCWWFFFHMHSKFHHKKCKVLILDK